MDCDYTISGARIYSLAAEDQAFSVMGVCEGKIIWLDDQLPDAPGDIFEMKGRTILPGFIDSHVHLSAAGLLTVGLDLRYARSFEDLRDSIASYLESDDYGGGMALGYGVFGELLAEGRLPNRFDLDKVYPAPAMVLIGGEGHSLTTNSAGIKELNVPEDHRGVDRDPISEQITGILYGDAYLLALSKLASAFSLDRLVRGLVNCNNLVASNGITFLHTSEGFGFPGDVDLLAVRAIAPSLDVGVRIYPQSRDVRKVQRLGFTQLGGCFATAVDGSTLARTAAFTLPYLDDAENQGILYFTQEEIDALVSEAHLAGLQVKLHAVGDRAIELALDAFSKALLAHPHSDHRHRLEHCIFPDEAQLDRIASLGLLVSTQPAFHLVDERLWESQRLALGSERLAAGMPLRAMWERGIRVAGSSDMPVVDAEPLAGVQGAVLHPNPSQRLTVFQALRMHTLNSAYAGFNDDCKGTLEVGKDADFVVLDQDPFMVDADHIRAIGIVATYIDGELWKPRPASWAEILWRSAGGHRLGRRIASWLRGRAKA